MRWLPILLVIGITWLSLLPCWADPPSLSADEAAVKDAWDRLASADGKTAYRAIWTLAGAPKASLVIFGKELKPVPEPDPKIIAQTVQELSDDFAVRNAAIKQIEEWGELAGPALQDALQKGLPLEGTRRAERLLLRLAPPYTSPDQLRQLRAVEALELINSDEARQLLKRLAEGAAEARLTKHARSAVASMTRHRVATPAAKAATTDFNGDPLPPGCAARFGTLRFRDVRNVLLLPDGKTLAAWNHDSLRLYDAASGKGMPGLVLKNEQGWQSYALSPNGRLLAAHAKREIGVWELSGKRLHTFKVRGDGFAEKHQLAFAADGQTLFGADCDMAYVWDLKAAKLVREFRLSGKPDLTLFSRDGRFLAGIRRDAPGREGLAIWDVESAKVTHYLNAHEDGISTAAFADDGKTLATGGAKDRRVRLWNVAAGELLREMPIDQDVVVGLAFAPGGKELAAATLDPLRPERGDAIYLWNLKEDKPSPRRMPLPGVRWVRYTADGKTLLCGQNGVAVRFFDAATLKERGGVDAHDDFVCSVAYSVDGALLATGSGDHALRIWDATTGRPLQRLAGHANAVCTVAFAPDGKLLLSGSIDGTSVLWDLSTGEKKRVIKHGRPGPQVASSADLHWLAAPGHNWRQLAVWDLSSGSVRHDFTEVEELDGVPAFSPDGALLAEVRKGRIVIRDVASGKVVRSLANPTRAASVAFAPKGRSLAAIAAGKVVVWEVITGAERAGFPTVYEGLGCFLTFSSDGRLLAFGRDHLLAGEEKTLAVWNLATGTEIGPSAYLRDVRAVALSPDGTRLVTGHSSGAFLWPLK